MSEQEKTQIGDGSDPFGNAASKAANAAKQIRDARNAVKTTAGAASAVKGSLKTGKAISEILAGTAAGGPIGALISAAWSMRHTLFKLLVCVCLGIVFLAVTVAALPGILLENTKNVSSSEGSVTLFQASYEDLASIVEIAVAKGHMEAENFSERYILEGGYDQELSMSHRIDLSEGMTTEDIYFILSAYSVSIQQNHMSREHLIYKLNSSTYEMFPVSFEERELVQEVILDDRVMTEIIPYVVCTIHPFDRSMIIEAFSLDLEARYGDTDQTYADMIAYYMSVFGKVLSTEE